MASNPVTWVRIAARSHVPKLAKPIFKASVYIYAEDIAYKTTAKVYLQCTVPLEIRRTFICIV